MANLLCTVTTLKAVPLFSLLSDEAVRAALAHVCARTYFPRSSVPVCGNGLDGLRLILVGRVHVICHNDSGRAAVLEELREHDFFNERGWLNGIPGSERYEAATACTILHLPRQLLEDWLAHQPCVAHFLMQALAARLSEARRRVASLAMDTVYQRVVDVLLERGHAENDVWIVDDTTAFIAALVGASREMVSRVVANLISLGLMRRSKRRLMIPNRSAFEAYVVTCRTSLSTKTKMPDPTQSFPTDCRPVA